MTTFKFGVILSQLFLAACASNGDSTAEGDNTDDDGTYAMVGAVVSGILGGLYGAETGDAVQAQNIADQSMKIINSMNNQNTDEAVQPDPTTAGDETTSAAETLPLVDINTFKPEEYMGSSGNCEKDLAYLSDRLHQYPDPLINQGRSAILNSDMHEIMTNINQMNITPDTAIQKSLQQAQEYDRVFHEAIQTAVQSDGYGTTAEQFERDIKSGTLLINECDGIRSGALCAAITYDHSAIGSRAVAANLMCYKRTNQWPTKM